MEPNYNRNYEGMRCRVRLVRENPAGEIIKIDNEVAVYELVKDELVNSDREMLLSIMLSVKNELIGVETVCVGSIRASAVAPRDIFKSAILSNAVSIILAHNHPSGDLSPSDHDYELTRDCAKAGFLLGIELLDHVIVSHRGYKSLRGSREYESWKELNNAF